MCSPVRIHRKRWPVCRLVLTQMPNFIKSKQRTAIGPIVQAMVVGEDRQMHLYMMQQATQFIGQMEQDYHMDAVLRVKNCLYAHYTAPCRKPAGFLQAAGPRF